MQQEEAQAPLLSRSSSNTSFLDSPMSVSSLDVGPRSKRDQAKTIVSKLTTEEKIQLCSGRDMWYLKPVRDILPAVMLTDGPHGVRIQKDGNSTDLLKNREEATCFPTASCLASCWDTRLLQEMGVALGLECVAHDVAVLLGPGMNIKRHPCGGRNFEYFSEDPLLSGTLASALVEGIQSQGVGTSIKHFVVNNQEWGRMRVDVQVDERTLREIYYRGFELCVKGKSGALQPWTIMCAYNRVNGSYCSENEKLYKMVREEWGFEGAVITDWAAANDRVRGLLAGVDLEMPGSQGAFDWLLLAAVESGEIPMEILEACAARNVALSLLGKDVMARTVDVDLDAHHELARRVALESAVLLKNNKHLLPLAKNTSIAVIGDFAKNPRYQGMGSSQVHPTRIDSAWDRLQEYTDKLVYATGYHQDNDAVDMSLIDEAVAAAKQADVAIVFCGLPEIDESEGFDRPHIDMPSNHNALVEAVCAANPHTVVILTNGSPVTMPWVDKADTILEGYLSGQGGGSALADLVFGVASPCGKLAETFPISLEDVASNANFPGDHDQVQYREGLNVGYRHFDSAEVPVLFPFGHGLSYTRFEYRDLQTKIMADGVSVEVKFTLQNVGSVRSAEVVQCYVHDVESTVYRPEQELKAFSKVWLDAGEHQEVQLTLEKQAFSFYDVGAKEWIVEPGAFEIRIGASSRDIRLRTTIDIATGQAPTTRACQAHPPMHHHLGVPVTDEEFMCTLGVDSLPPPITDHWPFHHNTLTYELRASKLGQHLQNFVFRTMRNEMQDPNDLAQYRMMEGMAGNTPLRGLVLFSQGNMFFEDLNLILAILNFRFLQFLAAIGPCLKRRLWRRR